jgi:hypothetical protein
MSEKTLQQHLMMQEHIKTLLSVLLISKYFHQYKGRYNLLNVSEMVEGVVMCLQ